MPIEDAEGCLHRGAIKVALGHQTAEVQIYQATTGNFVYWSPFTGERVTIDRSRLLKNKWPKPPAQMPPKPQRRAHPAFMPLPLDAPPGSHGPKPYADTWPKGAKPDATLRRRWRNAAYKEALLANKVWPPPPCPVGAAGLVPENHATVNHHMRGRAGTLLIDKRFFLAVSYAGDKWIHAHPRLAVERGWLAADADWGVAPDDAVTDALRRRLEPV